MFNNCEFLTEVTEEVWRLSEDKNVNETFDQNIALAGYGYRRARRR